MLAGDGGNGCISFRREKFIPKGGPDGGDGGNGGSVYLVGDRNKRTLMDFNYRKKIKAEIGQPGQGKNKSGLGGDDIVIKVPLGTQVYDVESGILLADITELDEPILIARGGKGGRGNDHFKSSINQTPRYAESGTLGEKVTARLELKLIADVGLVGCPNAGKSSLLTRLSSARPRIASYPFTTKEPVLGVVEVKDYASFVMADIPGLLEGAHKGVGLGDKFLKHIERTKILVHIIDLAGVDGRDPLDDFKTIDHELKAFHHHLEDKPQIVVFNKMDLPEAKANLARVKKALDKKKIPSLAISAATGEGLDKLKEVLAKIVQKEEDEA